MYISKKICRELSEIEIIQKSLEEVDYFSCLYEKYEVQLLRYIKRMGEITNEEAEDILQEAFIKIWKNLHAFDQSLKLSSWIYRIVHNQAISFIRKKKSYGKDKRESIYERIAAELLETDPIDRDKTEEDLVNRTHEVLDQLPLPFKEVIVLKYMENMSYEEISDILKIPEGTVATRINRAKKAFKKLSIGHPVLNDLLLKNHSV